MEQLAPHAKVFVNPAWGEQDPHGDIGRHECHGGDPEDGDWLTAHDGVVRDPTWPDAAAVCGECHDQAGEGSAMSLHAGLGPFDRMVAARADTDPEVRANVMGGMNNHCKACHASCGQCHVSRPTSAGGGLLDEHRFVRRPPTREVCTACHGSRVEHEYYGKNQGARADVHWTQRFMKCVQCHSGEEMHTPAPEAAHRFEAPAAPRCVDCHDVEQGPGARSHRIHKDRLSCQVCHAEPYKNCYGCHFGMDTLGFRYFRLDKSTLEVKIGRNSRVSEERPETFVTVRHIPVAPDSFRFYADNGLSRYSALPTWKLAAPHALRRVTERSRACNNCHGRVELFLTAADVAGEELEANRGVIVAPEDVPARLPEEDVAEAQP